MLVFVVLLLSHSPYPIRFSCRDLIIGLLSGLLVFIVNYMFSFCKRLLKRKRKKTEKNSLNKSLNLSAISILYSIPLSLFIKILIIILLACIEEFLFRSYLLSFTNAYFPLVLSVLINATAFYFIHCNLKIFELIFMGIVFSIITICTNNIFAAIVAHACNNILVYYVYKYIIVRKQKKEIIIKM